MTSTGATIMSQIELNKRILEAVLESGLNDYDQRSALGMARTWVDQQKPVKRSEMKGYEKRDDLAELLVGIMEEEEADPDECVAALAAARAKVNEPYLDPTMLGVGRRLSKPGEKRKAGEEAKAAKS